MLANLMLLWASLMTLPRWWGIINENYPPLMLETDEFDSCRWRLGTYRWRDPNQNGSRTKNVGIRNFPTLGMIVEGPGDRVSQNIDNCVYRIDWLTVQRLHYLHKAKKWIERLSLKIRSELMDDEN